VAVEVSNTSSIAATFVLGGITQYHYDKLNEKLMVKENPEERRCPLFGCRVIQKGLCFDISSVALSQKPTEEFYFNKLQKILDTRNVPLEVVIALCQAHAKFHGIDK
jgi:hypothetical protein